MEKTLKGKCALVCGGSDGLGFGAAKELARMGCDIVITGRSIGKLKEKIETLNQINGKVNRYISVDFSDTNILIDKIDTLINEAPIHILINNCGGPPPGKLAEAKSEDLMTAFRMHVIASHTITKQVLPSMISSDYGRIINIVSTSVRQPILGLGVSNTIRGAMASWSKTLSLELADKGITVNCILPGTTKTDRLQNILSAKQKKLNLSLEEAKNSMLNQIPMGRFAEIEEISKSVAFLASPSASYITGVNLQIDGGKIKSI